MAARTEVWQKAGLVKLTRDGRKNSHLLPRSRFPQPSGALRARALRPLLQWKCNKTQSPGGTLTVLLSPGCCSEMEETKSVLQGLTEPLGHCLKGWSGRRREEGT